MITIENLVGGYNHSPIINGIDLEIQKGEFFTLLGQNGSGKTTLFKLITGQLPIKRGKILLSGKEIQSLSKIEKAKKNGSSHPGSEGILRLYGRRNHQSWALSSSKGLF